MENLKKGTRQWLKLLITSPGQTSLNYLTPQNDRKSHQTIAAGDEGYRP